jgi:hypothetical protein
VIVDFVVQIDADGNRLIVRELNADKILSDGETTEAEFAGVIRPGCGDRGVLSVEEIDSDARGGMGIVFEIDLSSDGATLGKQGSR